jgi:hypothetical protein
MHNILEKSWWGAMPISMGWWVLIAIQMLTMAMYGAHFSCGIALSEVTVFLKS